MFMSVMACNKQDPCLNEMKKTHAMFYYWFVILPWDWICFHILVVHPILWYQNSSLTYVWMPNPKKGNIVG